MYIQPNKMLPPTSRIIRFYQCSLVSTEGPNINGKLNLAGIEIPYESQFTSRMILNPGALNQPIVYGFLGNNITFLALKITYDETNPKCVIEEEQFIEYWYENDSTTIRQAHKLMVLTGNSTNRIPQIYLNNPGDVKVYVDVLAANMEQGDIDLDDIRNDVVEFKNLYYNSIITDSYWNTSLNVSGSTQFNFLDLHDNIVLYLDFEEITSIEKNEDKNQLIINTKSLTIIRLFFNSVFEMNQANSRINWVINNSNNRYLTKDFPSIDVYPPLILMNPELTPIIEPNMYNYPYSGETISQYDILNYFIDTIYDDRDGNIQKESSIIKIRKIGEIETITDIIEMGVYDVIVTSRDIANNYSNINFVIIIDNEPPIINFKNDINEIFNMNIPFDLRVPVYGITKDDILRKTIDSIVDNVDKNIAISATTLLLNDDEFSPIFEPGQYNIDFIISDRSGNQTIESKVLIVDGDIILYPDNDYILGDAMVETNFVYTGPSGSTTNIIISGHTITIMNSGITDSGNTLIWDFGGDEQYEFTTVGEYINITINNTVFKITFKGWGSLLFSIEPIGIAPHFIDFNFIEERYLYNDTGITYIDVNKYDNEFYLYLDGNSGSTNNIVTNNIMYSENTFNYTEVFLESYILSGETSGSTSGETINDSLFIYYSNNYDIDLELLESILLGYSPILSLQTIDNSIQIHDKIVNDDFKFYINGNYPKGEYLFKMELLNNNFNNIFKFKLIIE